MKRGFLVKKVRLVAVTLALAVSVLCMFAFTGCNREKDPFQTHEVERVYVTQGSSLQGVKGEEQSPQTHYAITVYQRQKDNDVIIKATSSAAKGSIEYGTHTDLTVDKDNPSCFSVEWLTADGQTVPAKDNVITKAHLIVKSDKGEVINDVIIDYQNGSVTNA